MNHFNTYEFLSISVLGGRTTRKKIFFFFFLGFASLQLQLIVCLTRVLVNMLQHGISTCAPPASSSLKVVLLAPVPSDAFPPDVVMCPTDPRFCGLPCRLDDAAPAFFDHHLSYSIVSPIRRSLFLTRPCRWYWMLLYFILA